MDEMREMPEMTQSNGSGPLSRFRCVGCGADYPLTEVITSCRTCGEILDVVHDLAAFGRSGAAWRSLFDSRRSALPGIATPPRDISGVWRYREMVLPDLPDEGIVSKPEGNTRLYPGRALGEELGLTRLFVKHEGENPTLSFKDRGMTAGVSWAHHLGVQHVACASTGDTSAALAAYAAEVPGMKGVVLLPDAKITGEQLSQASTTARRRSPWRPTSTAACGSWPTSPRATPSTSSTPRTP